MMYLSVNVVFGFDSLGVKERHRLVSALSEKKSSVLCWSTGHYEATVCQAVKCVCVCVCERVTAASLQHTAVNSELCGNWEWFPLTTEAGRVDRQPSFKVCVNWVKTDLQCFCLCPTIILNNILRFCLCFQQHIHDTHCLHNGLQAV